MTESAEHPEPAIPKIYSLPEAAELLGVTVLWLRNQLTSRRFAALKRAGRWAMTDQQILAAIESMTVPAREPEEYPGGLSRRSWLYRQRYGWEGNPNRRRPKKVVPPPKVQPPPSYFHPVHAEPADVIAAMPDLTQTQLELLERVREEGEVVISGKTARKTVEALVKRGLATYEAEHVLNEKNSAYFYRFTVRPKEHS